MKTFTALILALTLSLSCVLADGQEALPEEINALLPGDVCDALVMTDTPSGDYAFAVVREGNVNTLYGYWLYQGEWRNFLKNARALPQGQGTFFLSNSRGTRLNADDTLISRDTLTVAYSRPDNEESYDLALFFSHNPSRTKFNVNREDAWLLTYVSDPAFQGATDAKVADGRLSFYMDEHLQGTAKGVLQRDIRHFSYAAFPKSLKEAKNKLSAPPEIPRNSTLRAETVKFTGGKKYAVYSGPGKEFLRAANGKASVSTNDWIQVFGWEDDWILIQYDLSSNQLRTGYIPKSALPAGAQVDPLRLEDVPAVVLENTYLTDDPLKSQSVLEYLDAGTMVTYLASMGDWAYIQDEGNKARGFVPLSALAVGDQSRSYSHVYAGAVYTASAQAVLSPLGEADITVEILAPEDWLAQPPILGYQVFGSNARLSPGAFDVSQESGGSLLFSFQVTVPAGANVLGLCPEYRDGVHTDEAITLFLED